MKIAIIDDQKADRQLISEFLHTYFSTHCGTIPLSIHFFESGEALLSDFTCNSFHLIFLDYYMDEMSGLETAFAVRSIDASAIIIFTTSSRDYAIDSYRVKASGYLVKPISYHDFCEILNLVDLARIKEQQCIRITNGYEEIDLLLKDIIYCDISGHYIQIHTQSSGIRRARLTFSELVELLEPYSEFLLCFRGCLINMNHVDHMDDLTFYMTGGDRIPLRKKERAKIQKAYSEFIFEKVRNANL